MIRGAAGKGSKERLVNLSPRLLQELRTYWVKYRPTDLLFPGQPANKPYADTTIRKAMKVDRHVYEYVFTDSKNEREFVGELDTSVEVVVYAKLPRSFFIPTPVGNYNPDWAIAFQDGKVKHVFFIAETKGSMSTLELRELEHAKIKCARKFFAKITSDQVKYDVVDSYGKLMELVK